MINTEITGVKELKTRLKNLPKNIAKKAFDFTLRDLGEKIGELSARKVPVQDGLLKASFRIVKRGNRYLVGYNKVYAAYQHEGGDGKRVIKNRPGGGESHFLSGVIDRNKDNLLKFANQRLEHHLKRLKL